MPILGIMASSTAIPAVYSLSQTFNTSGTYTVPAGKSTIALMVFNGGNPGTAGQSGTTSFGSAGGAGGNGYATTDFAVTAGASYTVTVGGSGGTSSFGTVLDGSGGG